MSLFSEFIISPGLRYSESKMPGDAGHFLLRNLPQWRQFKTTAKI